MATLRSGRRRNTSQWQASSRCGRCWECGRDAHISHTRPKWADMGQSLRGGVWGSALVVARRSTNGFACGPKMSVISQTLTTFLVLAPTLALEWPAPAPKFEPRRRNIVKMRVASAASCSGELAHKPNQHTRSSQTDCVASRNPEVSALVSAGLFDGIAVDKDTSTSVNAVPATPMTRGRPWADAHTQRRGRPERRSVKRSEGRWTARSGLDSGGGAASRSRLGRVQFVVRHSTTYGQRPPGSIGPRGGGSSRRFMA